MTCKAEKAEKKTSLSAETSLEIEPKRRRVDAGGEQSRKGQIAAASCFYALLLLYIYIYIYCYFLTYYLK